MVKYIKYKTQRGRGREIEAERERERERERDREIEKYGNSTPSTKHTFSTITEE